MMGAVDLAKTARARLIESLYPQPVVFHHVPKCAGTSVARALRRRYLLSQATVLPEPSFRAFASFTGRSDRDQMLVDVLDLREQMFLYLLHCGVKCVSAHVPFSPTAYQQFAPRYRFVTTLREPVQRFISHFYWSYSKPDAHARIDEPLERFLDTPRARRLGATYVEYYCGLPRTADVTSPDAIGAATRNLSLFHVVGFIDDMPTFCDLMQRVVGVRLRVHHENRGSAPTNQPLSPSILTRITELCAPDIAVWQHARSGLRNSRPQNVT